MRCMSYEKRSSAVVRGSQGGCGSQRSFGRGKRRRETDEPISGRQADLPLGWLQGGSAMSSPPPGSVGARLTRVPSVAPGSPKAPGVKRVSSVSRSPEGSPGGGRTPRRVPSLPPGSSAGASLNTPSPASLSHHRCPASAQGATTPTIHHVPAGCASLAPSHGHSFPNPHSHPAQRVLFNPDPPPPALRV